MIIIDFKVLMKMIKYLVKKYIICVSFLINYYNQFKTWIKITAKMIIIYYSMKLIKMEINLKQTFSNK